MSDHRGFACKLVVGVDRKHGAHGQNDGERQLEYQAHGFTRVTAYQGVYQSGAARATYQSDLSET
jgi:hypothetical protein